jgi:asparagine synthase (glutamine-hydrolysing)
MDAPERTWCHLSGGLDSSSVTSMAAQIANDEGSPRKLGGALTLSDSYIHDGEFPFAEEVIRKFNLNSRVIKDDWPWRDDGEAPPLSDQPTRDYPTYARDRAASRMIQGAGGTVLLTGGGADQLLLSSEPISADLVWQGEFRQALTELHHWSSCRGQSFWDDLTSRVVIPLVSRSLTTRVRSSRAQIPTFISPEFMRAKRLRQRFALHEFCGGPRGSYYQATVVRYVLLSSSVIAGWHSLIGVSTRHPFVDHELVEYVLRLPYAIRAKALWHKPILRNAMKGILPDRIRRRRTKGPPPLRVTWAFHRERSAIERLMKHSILADLGCIQPAKLLERVDYWAHGGQAKDLAHLYSTLALETWLQRSLIGA